MTYVDQKISNIENWIKSLPPGQSFLVYCDCNYTDTLVISNNIRERAEVKSVEINTVVNNKSYALMIKLKELQPTLNC